MFESRGEKEDSELKRQYARIYEFGTSYVSAGAINQRFTSKDIKLKNKESRIEGLELADLLALATLSGSRINTIIPEERGMVGNCCHK